ncbi:hypothetical protein BC835DRAFT_1375393 [Cytidiella melzeri]|nr:hypothetical protein BC835DRAFT_1375393 [Cytidiella melzeri]
MPTPASSPLGAHDSYLYMQLYICTYHIFISPSSHVHLTQDAPHNKIGNLHIACRKCINKIARICSGSLEINM